MLNSDLYPRLTACVSLLNGARQKMSDEVVDIRKRIEEMRNEAAIVSGVSRNKLRVLAELADIAISSKMEPTDVKG